MVKTERYIRLKPKVTVEKKERYQVFFGRQEMVLIDAHPEEERLAQTGARDLTVSLTSHIFFTSHIFLTCPHPEEERLAQTGARDLTVSEEASTLPLFGGSILSGREARDLTVSEEASEED
jgi:hypothetical protein